MGTTLKDYGLKGINSAAAVARGLAGAQWYASPIPRKEMKELMKRSDGPAVRDTLIWFAILGASGTALYMTWGSLWAIPAFLIYSIFYGSCGDSRWHECGHGTAFKTRWLNVAVYHLASFMILRNGTLWRWSHSRHHTDTIVVGRDPEIALTRPPNLTGAFLDLLYLKTGFSELRKLARHFFGVMTAEEKDFVPETERWKIFLEARLQALLLAAMVVWAVAIKSWLPLMLVGLPTFFGAWLDVVVFGYTQHAGLAEDVIDHRLNTRTVRLNPLFRFIYWNMNFHLEHHMFPMVPYHALPKLHEMMKDDCPAPYPNLWAAWKEIAPALWRQRRDPTYFVLRTLPPSARPVAEFASLSASPDGAAA